MQQCTDSDKQIPLSCTSSLMSKLNGSLCCRYGSGHGSYIQAIEARNDYVDETTQLVLIFPTS